MTKQEVYFRSEREAMFPTRSKPFMAMILPVFFCLTSLSLTEGAPACSTVAFESAQRPMLAYNFDFEATGAGFLTANSAGSRRQSITEGRPASWTAKYDSLTINQVGPGMPAAGMNTAGLVVTLMWNKEAVFGGPEDLPSVSELEFIQRLLDLSGSVEDALQHANDVRIDGLVPIHYFLFDWTGEAAVLTPGKSGLLVHQGVDLPVPALTNTPYPEALLHLGQSRGFGGTLPVPQNQSLGTQNSLDRFAIAANAARQSKGRTSTDEAFNLLNKLANSDTRWQMVFDPKGQKIWLRITGSSLEHLLDLSKLDFACQVPPLAIDLRQLSPEFKARNLSPIQPDTLGESLAEVLSSMRQTAHLGRAEIAGAIATGLIFSSSCTAK
ncbi:linear amide C-N hydrolase [uncultured Roseibium sp.]|uniref:linear amide C-N hydrolase n=1 Tax=uncultured Roseibium sp. TaxID=1936171 RepID=UPI00263455CC|nr:linear amide C-N hydrolase [uncultured Roseibium sp.]